MIKYFKYTELNHLFRKQNYIYQYVLWKNTFWKIVNKNTLQGEHTMWKIKFAASFWVPKEHNTDVNLWNFYDQYSAGSQKKRSRNLNCSLNSNKWTSAWVPHVMIHMLLVYRFFFHSVGLRLDSLKGISVFKSKNIKKYWKLHWK